MSVPNTLSVLKLRGNYSPITSEVDEGGSSLRRKQSGPAQVMIAGLDQALVCFTSPYSILMKMLLAVGHMLTRPD